MKRLTLVRHAKSSWDHPDLRDYERPLTKRGLRDAPVMGRVLKDRIKAPDMIVCSPAVRARTTADMVVEAMGLEADIIREDERIYAADTGDLLAVIRDLDEATGHAFLVGHCPGMLDLANLLCGECIESLPTCATVLLQVVVKQWSDTGPGTCTLDTFLYPKMFKR